MALDAQGLAMIAKLVPGASILCLGYPDITAPMSAVRSLLGVEPKEFTEYGAAHKISWPLPETAHTLKLAGATDVDCVDSMPSRGCERLVDLNVRQVWPRRYRLVLNPGTVEHCFDVAAAIFNAWRAVEPGGFLLNVAPVSMMNHGFWNVCPTALIDFAVANGGTVLRMVAKERSGAEVQLEPLKRFRVPPECVMYALMRKDAELAETMPVQGRYRG